MKTCILSYYWKLDICIYEAIIKHRIVSIVKVHPTKMLSSFWGGAIAPAVPIAFPLLIFLTKYFGNCLKLLEINHKIEWGWNPKNAWFYKIIWFLFNIYKCKTFVSEVLKMKCDNLEIELYLMLTLKNLFVQNSSVFYMCKQMGIWKWVSK